MSHPHRTPAPHAPEPNAHTPEPHTPGQAHTPPTAQAPTHTDAHPEPHPHTDRNAPADGNTRPDAHPHPTAHDQPHAPSADQAEILDLDAEILAAHIASITDWLPLTAAPRHIVDLGSGTGAGTFALLDRFPEAHVTAVDSSAPHLQRLREKACAAGLDGRVRTVQADLDAADWPDFGAYDLVWASASMHHMADPALALRRVRELLSPEGLLALVELSGFPRFLPPGEEAALEERAHTASDAFHAGHVPHRGADWGLMLTAAGFSVAGERALDVRIEAPENPAIGRYALASLTRLRTTVADSLSAEDLAALDTLIAPENLASRRDVTVRTTRQIWAARP
ncbi:class I SAM-dependent methyltransferase [Streptomyces sp. SPB074]|uniref:class I SAM-dependent methyltransferase n=1 Tax=Streptomyces sp. (strain SPB074) TaxID=465543 RepID=UPI00017F2295|nr:class I SAM-dependent methyltransferase [Streptomyces sp. SPB074]EDY45296.1 methyltransferase [Streptomyces sp. SPB074]